MNVYLIGLTGNIACGKSTVLSMLRERGARVLDADAVTRELQQPGQPVYHQIVAAFGNDMLLELGGPLDRAKLGALVFNDSAALRQLEQIVHPAVRERIMAWLSDVQGHGDTETRRHGDTETRSSSSSPGFFVPLVPSVPVSLAHPLTRSPNVAVLDAIKLLEGGWQTISDAVWVVTCTHAQQLERLISTRGMREADARARIAAQPPQADKVAQATLVIDNSGTLEQTRAQVDAGWQAIMEQAA